MSRPQIEANRLQDPGIRWEAMDLDREDTAGNELAGRFDIVLATEVIEHLENPAHFLRQALRLSVSGGRLILSTQSGRIGETEKRVGHRRHFSAEDMERLLAETGWTPRRVWNEGFPFHDWSKRAANLFPDAAMREFSDKPYGWAKRSLCLLLRSAFQLNSLRQGAQLFAVAENNSGISRET
jgi:SAM-dependent methyltransferase